MDVTDFEKAWVDEVFEEDELTLQSLPEDREPTQAELMQYASSHPVVRKVLDKFHARIVGIEWKPKHRH